MHHELFSAALGLSEPWFVDGLDFDERGRRLTVRVDFRRGARNYDIGFLRCPHPRKRGGA